MDQLSNIMHKEHEGFFYEYFENYSNDCNCMWRQNAAHQNVYSIERIDILPEFRRKGLAKKLLSETLKRIAVECPKACVEITAEPDADSELTMENLVTFYESLGFEKYQSLGTRVHLRLYLDDSVKPREVYDNPSYFSF
ncbi:MULTISPECIES: GNAT family N-acetyltransferase [Vibrio]|uniref:GNAT family N-acetyltransferase n=1 Tax=Vibrio TaxID=662 RepID=UPI000D399559|nr:GNAT family N-acetyltransferase [Vibrio splendidus]PTO53405.1 GNAT family N-acetyltransferase [Vibrio splendidus]